ncbi:hypothetical protein NLI96_g2699 [Meripilus lineatus]|uniref:Uncharacterized protein n=1 Tax=Meripilus lineatus TaxID=2056292 RepID=A0AAD5YH98_9APHY|nr:hypothetical protein NLI96_g2699 [Physisporinus lineatus]
MEKNRPPKHPASSHVPCTDISDDDFIAWFTAKLYADGVLGGTIDPEEPIEEVQLIESATKELERCRQSEETLLKLRRECCDYYEQYKFRRYREEATGTCSPSSNSGEGRGMAAYPGTEHQQDHIRQQLDEMAESLCAMSL